MAISLPRSPANSLGLIESKEVCSNSIRPLIWVFLSESKPIIAFDVTDFPLPDSPTMAKISFSYKEKSILLTTVVVFLFFPKEMFNPDTSSIFFVAIVSKIVKSQMETTHNFYFEKHRNDTYTDKISEALNKSWFLNFKIICATVTVSFSQ